MLLMQRKNLGQQLFQLGLGICSHWLFFVSVPDKTTMSQMTTFQSSLSNRRIKSVTLADINVKKTHNMILHLKVAKNLLTRMLEEKTENHNWKHTYFIKS